MFYFLEGEFRRGPNSVCSFLFKVINKIITKNIKAIYILSDSCGAQNKNYTVFKFLTWLAIYFKVKITQVFPVRGHSYCVCDRNFAVLSKSIKNLAIIETPEDYIKEFQNFNCIIEKGGSFNYSDCMNPYFESNKNLFISNASKIEYFTNGLAKLFNDYNGNPFVSTNLVINIKNCNKLFKKLKLDNVNFIAERKINAINKLLQFVTSKNQIVIKNHLNKSKSNESKKLIFFTSILLHSSFNTFL
jgi:hypothetical protein